MTDPFCILSIVDNRTFKRLAYQVLSHAPTAKDVEAFFRRFQRALEVRGPESPGDHDRRLGLVPGADRRGLRRRPPSGLHIPRPARADQGGPRCRGQGPQGTDRQQAQAPRGRPTKATRRLARRKKRIEQKVGALFEHRYLFVQRRLSPGERRTLLRITRGLPQLRVLRELMEEVYRLFDRRCRTDTALAKLAKLRSRLRRFGRLRVALKKLLAPGLEKALVFLDERLLGATSNAVERGNRRYRKMQKTVYRVRTQRAIEGRLALDLQRERQGDGRAETTHTLHKAAGSVRGWPDFLATVSKRLAENRRERTVVPRAVRKYAIPQPTQLLLAEEFVRPPPRRPDSRPGAPRPTEVYDPARPATQRPYGQRNPVDLSVQPVHIHCVDAILGPIGAPAWRRRIASSRMICRRRGRVIARRTLPGIESSSEISVTREAECDASNRNSSCLKSL